MSGTLDPLLPLMLWLSSQHMLVPMHLHAPPCLSFGPRCCRWWAFKSHSALLQSYHSTTCCASIALAWSAENAAVRFRNLRWSEPDSSTATLLSQYHMLCVRSWRWVGECGEHCSKVLESQMVSLSQTQQQRLPASELC